MWWKNFLQKKIFGVGQWFLLPDGLLVKVVQLGAETYGGRISVWVQYPGKEEFLVTVEKDFLYHQNFIFVEQYNLLYDIYIRYAPEANNV